MEKVSDFILAFIEKWSSWINCWAWDKRWKERKPTTQKEWLQGYTEWKAKQSSK